MIYQAHGELAHAAEDAVLSNDAFGEHQQQLIGTVPPHRDKLPLVPLKISACRQAQANLDGIQPLPRGGIDRHGVHRAAIPPGDAQFGHISHRS